MGTEKKENLEEMFDRLDQVIGTLEGEDVSLEEAFGLYDQGMKLIRRCNQTINEVEKKILVLDENGEKHDFYRRVCGQSRKNRKDPQNESS